MVWKWIARGFELEFLFLIRGLGVRVPPGAQTDSDWLVSNSQHHPDSVQSPGVEASRVRRLALIPYGFRSLAEQSHIHRPRRLTDR